MPEASAEAQRTGRRIEVGSLRTERSQTFANPSGTFTVEEAFRPQRTKVNGRWQPVDSTLVVGADGRVRPKASTIGMSFSGGGSAPLAELDNLGRKLSFTWDEPLPAPVLSGSTATYAEVLPGVDLVVNADVDIFSEVFVVKNAAAAANPKLSALRFATSSYGVNVTTTADGTVRAADEKGREFFAGSQPHMWDATPPPAAARSAAADADAPGTESEPDAPGETTLMAARMDGSTLEIVPDQGVLSSPSTVFPVVIDPVFGGTMLNWATAYKPYPNNSFWNGANFNEGDGDNVTKVARVGYETDTGGTARSFFQLNTRNLWDVDIISSTLRITADHSWSCTSKTIAVYDTPSIYPSLTWNSTNNSTWWGNRVAAAKTGNGGGSNCPAGPVEWNVTSIAQTISTSHWLTWSLGLRADDESTANSWTKFLASSAVMSTEYNTPPGVPDQLHTSPDSGEDGSVVVGDVADLTLFARGQDADGGSLTMYFRMWPDGGNITDIGNVNVAAGQVASLTVPASFPTPTGTYYWDVVVTDGRAWVQGPVRPLTINRTVPSSPPTITSADFTPVAGATADARQTGTFVFGPNGAAGITAYEWWSDWDKTHRTVAADPTGSASIQVRVPIDGPRFLMAKSMSAGGNTSDEARYYFYADSQGFADIPGDMNGDQTTDVVAVDTTGRLKLYPGLNNGLLGAPGNASTVIDRDGAKYWQNNLMTRYGDRNNDDFEDLVVRRLDPATGKYKIYVHPGLGDGYVCIDCDTGVQAYTLKSDEDPNDAVDNDHFQNASQILAVGNVTGDDWYTGDPTLGWADLLVKTGDDLWLYKGSGPGMILDNEDPILIGSGGWSTVTIAYPGDTNGDLYPDLWVRFNGSGNLYVYPGAESTSLTSGIGSGTGNVQIATGVPATTATQLLAQDLDYTPTGTNNCDLRYINPTTGQLVYMWGLDPTAPGQPTTLVYPSSAGGGWTGYTIT